MSTKNAPANEEVDVDEAEQRSKIVQRLMLAAGTVAVLLALLWFFDYLARPTETPEAPEFTEPVPVQPQRPVAQPITPPETPPEVLPREETVPPPAEGGEPPPLEPPAPPLVEAVPSLPPAVAPSAFPPPVPAMPTPAVPAPAVPASKAPPSATVRQVTPPPRPPTPSIAPRPSVSQTPVASPPIVPEFTAPPEITLPPESVTPPAPPPSTATPPRVGALSPNAQPAKASGFFVQAGVFVNPQRAEALRDKLKQNGIPATLETRVQVGPFSTQAEAERARTKMRELGIQGILVPPPR